MWLIPRRQSLVSKSLLLFVYLYLPCQMELDRILWLDKKMTLILALESNDRLTDEFFVVEPGVLFLSGELVLHVVQDHFLFRALQTFQLIPASNSKL